MNHVSKRSRQSTASSDEDVATLALCVSVPLCLFSLSVSRCSAQVATGERFTACTFVEQTSGDSRFFAAPTTIEGGRVVEAHRDLGSLSAAEQANYDEMLPALQSQIAKGEEFARSFSG